MTQQRGSTPDAGVRPVAHPSEPHAVGAELVDVSKAFGATQAHKQVQLHFGEVLALVGENGAGKSTCVKVLGGVHQQDAGTLVIQGQSMTLKDPMGSRRHGVAVVNQHPGLPKMRNLKLVAVQYGLEKADINAQKRNHW